MSDNKIISKTKSLCPICMKKIDADILSQGDSAYMEKHCIEHGDFRTIVWKGSIPMESWVRKKERVYIKTPQTENRRGCPFDCGLCSEHRQYTCLALIEVTKRCNLHCAYCFADSKACKETDPSIEQIRFLYESVLNASGVCSIQISGGEPTVRDDLPLIVKTGTELDFNFIQLNTNGIRIGEDEEFLKQLKVAGLSSVYLQFDGTKDSIYKKLRGRELLDLKIKAIENCEKNSIGVVLVPTLVPGVNIDNIGEIIRFALENTPVVRGVHFQPVSHFGRVPAVPEDKDRITLPEVIEEIERQTEGQFTRESLRPPGSENELCSFHGSYMYNGKNNIVNVTNASTCCCHSEKAEEGVQKCKAYVSRNWSYNKSDDIKENSGSSWDDILLSIRKSSFSISAMAFQDVWNVDLERVKDCCIHVVSPEGKLIPFCLYNITDAEGRFLYRK